MLVIAHGLEPGIYKFGCQVKSSYQLLSILYFKLIQNSDKRANKYITRVGGAAPKLTW